MQLNDAHPDFRVFVVVSRQALIDSRFSTIICAPVYSTRHGLANAELDADVWGLWLSLLSGYDPYAGAGTLAKMEMLAGRADLASQYILQILHGDEHGSFNERLDFIYDNIVAICKEEQVACNSYREFFHPHFPEGELFTTLPVVPVPEMPDRE